MDHLLLKIQIAAPAVLFLCCALFVKVLFPESKPAPDVIILDSNH